jgi:hypothetical protein
MFAVLVVALMVHSLPLSFSCVCVCSLSLSNTPLTAVYCLGCSASGPAPPQIVLTTPA